MSKVERELRIFGLRRSGNHAIINWILKNSAANSVFINDHELDKDFDNHLEKISEHEAIDTFIHSYEEQRFGRYHLLINDYYKEKLPIESKAKLDILILRDPLNLFASRIKSGYTSTWRTPRLNQIDLFILYAKEFLNKTCLLKNKLCINYNDWVSSEKYREHIASKLGLPSSTIGINDVSVIGGGSSFDQMNFSGQASEMKVLDRWQAMKESDSFLDCLNNKYLISLSKQIFKFKDEAIDFLSNDVQKYVSNIGAVRHRIKIFIYPIILDLKYKKRNAQLIHGILSTSNVEKGS